MRSASSSAQQARRRAYIVKRQAQCQVPGRVNAERTVRQADTLMNVADVFHVQKGLTLTRPGPRLASFVLGPGMKALLGEPLPAMRQTMPPLASAERAIRVSQEAFSKTTHPQDQRTTATR